MIGHGWIENWPWWGWRRRDWSAAAAHADTMRINHRDILVETISCTYWGVDCVHSRMFSLLVAAVKKGLSSTYYNVSWRNRRNIVSLLSFSCWSGERVVVGNIVRSFFARTRLGERNDDGCPSTSKGSSVLFGPNFSWVGRAKPRDALTRRYKWTAVAQSRRTGPFTIYNEAHTGYG